MKRAKPGRDSGGRFKEGHNISLKHGYYPFKISGKVPSVKGAKALKAELISIKAGLEAITPDMNIKKALLIEQVVNARGFMRLFEMYCKDKGILDPRFSSKVIDFQPGFKVYLSFAGQQHKLLMALGLDTGDAEKILTPFELAEKIDKEEAAKEEAKK